MVKCKIKILLIISLLFFINTQNEPLTSEEVQGMNRMSSAILSPDGKYVVYTVRKWNKETGKSSINLQLTEVETKNKGFITPSVEDQSDSNPIFSKSFPNYLFFLRDGKILYIEFPPSEITIDIKEDKSKIFAEYILPINEFKLKNNAFVFNTDVYFSCETMECSKDLIDNESKGYQIYNNLFMVHWDEWLREGKGSHLFYQKFHYNEAEKKFELENQPKDITLKMEINTPPLFSSNEHYDISNDGNKIVFSGHLRNHEEAWSSSWKTYYIDIEKMKNPILISGHNTARTQSPQFSLDDSKIAYLAMNTPMLESENLHFEIYNILTNKIYIIDDSLDLSVNSYFWENDHLIYFQATILGLNKIFTVDIYNYEQPIFSAIDTKSLTCSYDLPIKAFNNKNIRVTRLAGYNCPDKIVSFPQDQVIVDINEDLFKTKELPEPMMFNFLGAHNDTVYGWIIKPINFEEGKKYPTALLIHGGPESSWTSDWSFRWNPTLYAQQGYAVIMINIHGSTGVSLKFQTAVRNDWGGAPYEDILKGINYIKENYNFIYTEKMCASGGSYGGFMINWINGHTDIFKCLVNHDGDFSEISNFYGTDEIWFMKAEFCPLNKTGCNPFDGKEIRDGFEKNSPERFVKNWKTPTLVIHGGKDMRVPVTEGLQTFTSLQLNNVDSKFLFFPMENHWTLKPENQVQWHKTVFEWFAKYLKQ